MELKNIVINVLGDSITAGVGTSGPEQTFHAVLGRAIGAKEVRNYGDSGTRIARQQEPAGEYGAYVTRYAAMDDEADLILVFGGTNDYGHGNAPFGTMEDRTPDTFYGACHLLFRGLIEKYPRGQIVIMTPLQRKDGGSPCPNTGLPLLAYVDAIKEVAGFYSLPVLDLYREAGICPDIPNNGALFCPDGLHPNDAGAVRLAHRLEGFLRAL